MLSLIFDYSLFKLYIFSSRSLACNSIRIEHSLSHLSIVKLFSVIHLINSLVCNYADCWISAWLAFCRSVISFSKLVIYLYRRQIFSVRYLLLSNYFFLNIPFRVFHSLATHWLVLRRSMFSRGFILPVIYFVRLSDECAEV